MFKAYIWSFVFPATLLSLLLTYTLTALIFIIFLRKRIWDYAITIGFVHLILSCAGKNCIYKEGLDTDESDFIENECMHLIKIEK